MGRDQVTTAPQASPLFHRGAELDQRSSSACIRTLTHPVIDPGSAHRISTTLDRFLFGLDRAGLATHQRRLVGG